MIQVPETRLWGAVCGESLLTDKTLTGLEGMAVNCTICLGYKLEKIFSQKE